MATVKIVALKNKIKGKVSIKIQINNRFERKQIHLLNIESNFWNDKTKRVKSSHHDFSTINKMIASRINTIENSIQKLSLEQNDFSIQDILQGKSESLLLSEAIDNYSKALNYKSKRKFDNLKSKIVEYYDTRIDNIDINYFKGFIRFLQEYESINSQVTVHRYSNFLKTVLRNSNFNDQDVLNFKVRKGTSTKAKLTREEFKLFCDVEGHELSKDAFRLCLFLWGSRIGDVLQLRNKNLIDNKIRFIEQKTGKSKTVLIDLTLKDLLEKYSGHSNFGYLIPILKMKWKNPKTNKRFQKHIESKTAIINKDLKLIAAKAGIEKNLSTHVARHTFASWADLVDINSRTIQKMMNFSSLSIMENYLEEIRREDLLFQSASRLFKAD